MWQASHTVLTALSSMGCSATQLYRGITQGSSAMRSVDGPARGRLRAREMRGSDLERTGNPEYHNPQRDETRLVPVGLGEMVGILTFTFTFIFRSARRDLGRIRIARNASVASKET